jgi:hypothetical protein
MNCANINTTGADAHNNTAAAPSIAAIDGVTDGFSTPREKEHQQQQSEAAEQQEDAPTQTIHSERDEGDTKELKHAVKSRDSKKMFQEFKKHLGKEQACETIGELVHHSGVATAQAQLRKEETNGKTTHNKRNGRSST